MTKETKPKEKTVTKTVNKAKHRIWLTKGDDTKLFEEGDVIPAGYKDPK